MRVMLWASIILTAVISGVPTSAHQSQTLQPPQDCENAPPDAVLQIPAPAGYWMRIICTPTGHTLAPASGDAWQIHQDARSSSIPAGGDGTGGPNSSYFVKATVRETTGTDSIWAQDLFANGAGLPVPPEAHRTYALDLTDNHGNRNRIYVFVGDEGPVAGVACLRSCDNTVTVTVVHPEAAPME